jgi:hypothetical protein
MLDANVTQDKPFEVRLLIGKNVVIVAFVAAATALIYATLRTRK